ncbi:MAG: hypothetical protein PHT69_13135, partial [Bacteroidales bacterium]|nr:hypothetical protein [Bacteroidales bacterium]
STFTGQGQVVSVSPGFYYFYNPTGTIDISDGYWIKLGSGGDNLYTADGTINGNRLVDVDGNNIAFGDVRNYKIGENPQITTPSAIMELESTTKGILIPRLKTTERNAISSPANGLLVYDLDYGQFWYFNGTIWVAAIGPQGPIGLTGPAGAVGPTGPMGLTGITGPTGPEGDMGMIGPPGPTGLTGLPGVTGPTGPQGIQGDVGPIGPQGNIGLTGATGNTGLTGPTGPEGDIGMIGPPGPTGLTGSPGPVGPTGPQGPQGVQGNIGATGATGAIGAQGLTGNTGAIGATGVTGAIGAQGIPGPQGNVGATGVTGAVGAVGAQGPIGNTGAIGAQGIPGIQGNVGSTGVTGAVGAVGAQGPIGNTGAIGSTGVTGAIGAQGIPGPQGNVGATGVTGAVGAVGAQGPIGNTGAIGATGVTGAIGAQGIPGIQGNVGSTGVTGAVGAVGAQGPIGNTGAIGATGVTGAIGAQGPQGPQGNVGATGVTGAVGAVGAQGPVGNTGAKGATGVTGAQGLTGNTGAIGATGVTGAIGAQGIPGIQGNVGATGVTGAVGAVGAQGPIGNTGAKGATGATGAQGLTGNTGAIGATGVTGAIGAQGPQGPQGNVGATGVTGAVGAVGAQGPIGNTGAKGATGVTGAQGLTGNTGAIGATGVTGAIGAQGIPGPQGNVGATGVTGAVGAVGAQGPIGNTGAKGATGVTGAIGAQGPQGPQGNVGATGVTGATGPLVAGTSGQTLRHDGSSWVANSILLNNGINVSIGSSAPSATYRLRIESGSGNQMELVNSGTSKSWRYGVTNNDFQIIETGINIRMALLAGGNVGIGTTTPGARLSVSTTGSALSNSAASTTFTIMAGALGTLTGNTLKLASIGFTSSNQNSLGIEARRVANGSDWQTSAIGLKFDVDATSPVNNAEIWFHNNGNIGVGTYLPESKIHSVINSDTTFGIQALNTNSVGTGILGLGNNSSVDYLLSGSGVTGISSNIGVWGYGGAGVYGNSDALGGTGVWGKTTAENSIAGFFINESTSDSLVGLYCENSGSGSGTGYGLDLINTSIMGYAYWGNSYCFGVSGYRYNDLNRSGGTFGGSSTGSTPTSWGSLGYRNSSSAHYGVYGSSAYASGGGFNSSTIAAGIAIGGYGDMLGSWSHGEVMGSISKGELFSQYNIGNVFTSGTQVDIVNTGSQRVAAYSVTSPEMKVYDNGFATLTGSEVYVPFTNAFASLLGGTRPNVTVSAVGQAVQMYIKSITPEGFTVAVTDNTTGTEFSWIAVGSRVDAEQTARIPVDILDAGFDENLDAFMFNENNREHNAGNMWWDGSKLRFDAMPENSSTANKIKSRTAKQNLLLNTNIQQRNKQ